MINKKSKNKGAVLLIAILVGSVALAVGFGVYNRTYKELLLVSFWKQSQEAFYAADTGLECALYWDTRVPQPTSATCFGATVPGWNPSAASTSTVATLAITSPICVNIEIIKSDTFPFTTINARGYNTCDSNNTRRLERGLRVEY